MQDQIKQLKQLQKKVLDTWNLLNVDAMIVDMKKLEEEMQQEGFWNNTDRAKEISQKHEELRKEISTWTKISGEIKEYIEIAESLEKQEDKEMEVLVNEKNEELQKQFDQLEFVLLLSKKYDKNNAIVTFHAGSGGTDAQDWAEMLFRMIIRYVEKKGWKATIIEESKGQEVGIKSATVRIEGRYAFGHLKSEHGTHRLVRISPFDGDKARHTSFAGIEIIPEIDQGGSFEIDAKDLRIDTFMSSGKGGQSVNTTYSAVRIVHIPTNTVVTCQNERSQIQNKETAMKVLQSKLQQLKDEQDAKERNELRGEYKSAEWGNQIRSYVLHPYKMVKDVRSGFETTNPDRILDGNLDEMIEAYLRYLKMIND